MSEFVVKSPIRKVNLLPDSRTARLCGTLVVALAIVLSATGACDTDNLGIIHRTSLWLVICSLVVIQAVALRRRVAPHIGSAWFAGSMAIGATVVLTTVETHMLKFTPFLPKEPDPPLEFLLFILPLAGPVALLALYMTRSTQPIAADITIDADSVDRSQTTDCERSVAHDLESWPHDCVLRVSAEDHYLSVYTENNVALIRGRMKDALAILAGKNGLQIHRSHWIAIDEVARTTRQGRDYRVFLADGTSLPVSRARVAALKQRLDSRVRT
ncbi:MAG: LytTR family DNA-binding domain-containing protein [Pseudomonadota bacterium]